ncbi:flagellar hook-length control protein FliK [Pleomorphomonas koreensis]|uniref:flagellar hook-length control protein FliK n=1 Tax=Pleomorphomonas koreensis TaxID=257440 RepID=UPI0004236FB2|nr:flagellar hook-length control protein FliK [Pleomorphomonas koreensis]
MAIGSLPPVINEIQANSGQPGKMLARQSAAASLLDLQAAATAAPTSIVPETTLIDKAVAEALGKQGGLAPLYATLSQLAKSPDLPDAVKTAIDSVLAFQISDGDVTPERVAEAIRASGLFHEAVAAGKMAAALPPAVRQALGGTPEEKKQAAPPSTTTGRRPADAPTTASAPAVSRPAPAANSQMPTTAPAYGRPVPPPPTTTSPTTAQAPQSGTAAPAAALTASSSPAAPGTIPAAPGAVPAAPTSTALPQVTVTGQAVSPPSSPAAPSPAGTASTPAPAVAADVSAPLPSQPPNAGTVAQPASQAAGGAAPALPQAPGAPTASPANQSGTAPGSTSPAQASAAPTASAPTSTTAAATQTPVTPPAAASPSGRSFAPWMPGRPMAATTPAASPAAPAGVAAEASRPAPSLPLPPAASGETPVVRAGGERAPFVPSTVESLPNAPSQPASRPSPTQPAAPSANPAVSAGSTAATTPTAGPGVVAGSGAAPAATSPARPAVRPDVAIESPASVRPPATPPSALPAPGADLKGALEMLRRELIVWLGRSADLMASLDGAADDGTAPRVDRPAPPRKGGPVRGQPAMPLSGEDDAKPVSSETLAGRALGEAERSLSRVFLHQAATAESRDARTAQPSQALMLEIPIAGPNGTSIAQLRIERDDRAPSEPGAPPRRVFQVDIAFDVAPLGPVAVRVGLMDGRRVAVGVWCDSDDGLVRLEAERANIVLGLEQEGMTVAGVDLHKGHPPEGRDEGAAAGNHRLDLQL